MANMIWDKRMSKNVERGDKKSSRQFARSNMAAAAAGGCLRQRGGAETARVTGAGGESARADEARADM